MKREGLLVTSMYRISPQQTTAKLVLKFPDLENLKVHFHAKEAR
jgi:hypothetical protein